jgi:hypothetical protein
VVVMGHVAQTASFDMLLAPLPEKLALNGGPRPLLLRDTACRTQRLQKGRPMPVCRTGRRRKPSRYQRDEAPKHLAGGETCRAIARTFGVHHATISRLS